MVRHGLVHNFGSSALQQLHLYQDSACITSYLLKPSIFNYIWCLLNLKSAFHSLKALSDSSQVLRGSGEKESNPSRKQKRKNLNVIASHKGIRVVLLIHFTAILPAFGWNLSRVIPAEAGFRSLCLFLSPLYIIKKHNLIEVWKNAMLHLRDFWKALISGTSSIQLVMLPSFELAFMYRNTHQVTKQKSLTSFQKLWQCVHGHCFHKNCLFRCQQLKQELQLHRHKCP